MRIFKYPLEWSEHQTLSIPPNFVPLTLQVQNGQPTLWAKVDEQAAPEMHRVNMYPTGAALPGAEGNYLGTLCTTFFVFHFFVEVSHENR